MLEPIPDPNVSENKLNDGEKSESETNKTKSNLTEMINGFDSTHRCNLNSLLNYSKNEEKRLTNVKNRLLHLTLLFYNESANQDESSDQFVANQIQFLKNLTEDINKYDSALSFLEIKCRRAFDFPASLMDASAYKKISEWKKLTEECIAVLKRVKMQAEGLQFTVSESISKKRADIQRLMDKGEIKPAVLSYPELALLIKELKELVLKIKNKKDDVRADAKMIWNERIKDWNEMIKEDLTKNKELSERYKKEFFSKAEIEEIKICQELIYDLSNLINE